MYLSELQECDELLSLLEETFDTCSCNRDELYWLFAVLRCLMNCPNNRLDCVPDNYRLNLWQYYMKLIIDRYKKRWYHYG